MKLNKACDIYKLTVEHLRFLCDDSLILILKIISSILNHIKILSSPQLNTSVASMIYKGKSKPSHLHKSYRLVRVTPLLARSPRRSTGDKSGLCNWILCLLACVFWANFLIFIQYSTVEYSTVQYKAAGPVRAVISIRYGSKEGVQGSLLVPQYIRP